MPSEMLFSRIVFLPVIIMQLRARYTFFRIIVSGILAIIIQGCNVTRNIPENSHLLNKNIIKTDQTRFRENLNGIIKQKPNRRILGIFRFHLGVYNLGSRGNETGFKRWLKNIGEEPVILDTALMDKSSEQLSIFMQNNGYFNAVVTDSVKYKKKKAKVYYTIESGTPYLIRNQYYEIPDTGLRTEIFRDTSKKLIRSQEIYSATTLQKERERISAALRNKGYYFFNPLYITYKVDTSLNSHLLDVYMSVASPRSSQRDTNEYTDTATVHRKAYLQKIYVDMEYDPIAIQEQMAKDTFPVDGYYFISNNPRKPLYKPSRIAEHIFLKQDELFMQDNLDLTYRRLGDLSVFRFINIRFEASGLPDSSGKIPLTCMIMLSPSERQEYKIEAEGTNNGGNLGVAGNISYRNKNIFRGAESFDFRIRGGLEIQRNFSDTTFESIRQLAIFNAYEIGPEVSLNFPRFLLPFGLKERKKTGNPGTSITAAFNTQNRPEYYRQLANLSYYYTWRASKYQRHYVYPAEINYLNVDLDPAFVNQLLQLNDFNIFLGYVDQLIANGRYSFVYSNQELNEIRNYSYFRFNFESAGNSIYLAKKINSEEINAETGSEVFNVRFAQYIRPDFDYRFYRVFNRSSMLVFRYATGVGYAYGNSIIMPFEKSFYAGGPNDIRAWRSRSIGPGSSGRIDFFERFGDLKINSNVEYRFDIYRKLKGAAFVDAGNVWFLRTVLERPGGEFRFNRFADEIAIGSGLGLRMDFSFFIIRMDGAVQLKDPSMPKGDRWVFRADKWDDVTFNFGIGYPF